jgi:hypothetical protein
MMVYWFVSKELGHIFFFCLFKTMFEWCTLPISSRMNMVSNCVEMFCFLVFYVGGAVSSKYDHKIELNVPDDQVKIGPIYQLSPGELRVHQRMGKI